MDLAAPLSQYCERLGPGLLAEPFNAASNAAFLLACGWLLLALRQRGDAPWYARVLAALIGLIGLGSLSFHTFANRGTEILDVLFIALFIHFYVACFFRRFLGLRWGYAWLAAPGFVLFGLAVKAPLPAGALNGSVDYLPALFGLALMALYLAARRDPAARLLGAAAAVFVVSLALRTGDRAWCAALPLGTHWLWHSLNALTLSLVTLSLLPPATGEMRR
ncbi:MAG: hypothetical protein ISP90_11550 [Nevskia sp.]|nr:hypothetical protein [Nevskia sp.]